MTVARAELVDLDVTRSYHCISRCVRRGMLCGEGFEHRKQWIEDRLERLAGSFAMSVCGFAVVDTPLDPLQGFGKASCGALPKDQGGSMRHHRTCRGRHIWGIR